MGRSANVKKVKRAVQAIVDQVFNDESFFFSSRRRHTRFDCDWSSDVCSSDLLEVVNWCPRCGTAVSDLEVVHKETDGLLYRIRYDVSGVPSGAVVATTRPETMLDRKSVV